MTISTLPPAPQPTDDRSNFNSKAFTFNAALEDFVDEANDLASDVNADAAAAAASQSAAASSASAAATSQSAAATSAAQAASAFGAIAWVSGTTYAIGDVRWSPANYLVYRRKTSGAGTTDPSSDSTNWALAMSFGPAQVIRTTTTETVNENENSLCTNASAVAVTLPASPSFGAVQIIEFTNGRFDNTVNLNGLSLTGNGNTLTGTVTINQRTILRLRYWGSSYGHWRNF